MYSSTNTALGTLPLEVLMKINFYLDLPEYVSLQASSMRLRVSLKADDVCRYYVKVYTRILDQLQMIRLIRLALHELYIGSGSRTEWLHRLQYGDSTSLPYQNEV